MIPSKLNKMTWVRKGGFVIVEESNDANIDTKVTGTIIQVSGFCMGSCEDCCMGPTSQPI